MLAEQDRRKDKYDEVGAGRLQSAHEVIQGILGWNEKKVGADSSEAQFELLIHRLEFSLKFIFILTQLLHQNE